MKIEISCLLLCYLQCCALAAKEVPCEIIFDYNWAYVGELSTCDMRKTTVIESPGVTISSNADSSVEALHFNYNRQVVFLPANTAQKFDSLIIFSAGDCSISSVDKANFEGLTKLKELYLHDNKIEIIESDYFEDLEALEVLWLNNNKLKFMNGAALIYLNNLVDVNLNGNICITGWYKKCRNATAISMMISNLDDKCNFHEQSQ